MDSKVDLNKQRADLVKVINYRFMDPSLSKEQKQAIVEGLRKILENLPKS